MDEHTFKHCQKGHYYQGDECPYCKSLMPMHETKAINIPRPSECVGCPNRHAYNRRLFCCPYCGETKVTSQHVDILTAWARYISIELWRSIPIKVDRNPIINTSRLEISWLEHRYSFGYRISNIDIDYKSNIEIEDIHISGKQLIAFIDSLISNIKDFKVSL